MDSRGNCPVFPGLFFLLQHIVVAMKNFCLVLLLPLAASCVALDSAVVSPGEGQKRNAPYVEENEGNPWDSYPFAGSDTTLWFSAVCGDTSSVKVCLFRNWVPVLELEPGKDKVSVDEDLHHVLNGHLYTEFIDAGSSVVCRDGVEIYHSQYREFLVGLLENGGNLYSLSRGESGRGFTLRKNGQLLLARDYGVVFGDFSEPSYAPGGALYEDGEHYYFSYAKPDGGYCLVEDGYEKDVEFPGRVSPLQDIRVWKGRVEAASWRLGYADWENSRLWHDDRDFIQTGDVSLPYGVRSSMMDVVRTGIYPLSERGAVLYFRNGQRMEEQSLYGIIQDSIGRISVLNRLQENEESVPDGRYAYFRPCCGKLTDDGMLLGLNPKEGAPLIVYKGRSWPLSWIDGTITAVDLEISPPS